jgi:pimeloyl-ACP methyl ester carboxylesterase
MTHFAPRWQVFALDARGHGRSGRTPGRYRWLDHAGDLAAFLAAVVREPAVLIGHSLGALQALAVAAEMPARVAAIVLEDPPFYAAEHPDADVSQFRAMEMAVRAGMTVDQILAARPPTPGMSDALRREYAEGLTELDPENLAVTINRDATLGFDVDATLARVRCPALLLRAGASGVLSEEELSRALGRLERGRAVTIPDAGHQIHAEQPVRFREEVERFLGELR